jgi:hypothetical protein
MDYPVEYGEGNPKHTVAALVAAGCGASKDEDAGFICEHFDNPIGRELQFVSDLLNRIDFERGLSLLLL